MSEKVEGVDRCMICLRGRRNCQCFGESRRCECGVYMWWSNSDGWIRKCDCKDKEDEE